MQQFAFDIDIDRVDVTHDSINQRFLIHAEGQEGVLNYRRMPEGVLEYQKTYLDKNLRGRGWSRELVKHALNYAKKHRVKIKPSCPLVSDYMAAHPEYRYLEA